MFDGQSILAQVRAGEAEPSWLVLPAQRRVLLRQFLSLALGLCFGEVFFLFTAVGGLGVQQWIVALIAGILGIAFFRWLQPLLHQVHLDLKTWSQQYAVLTPEGFLIATSEAIKPRICLRYQDIRAMELAHGRVSSENGTNAATSHLYVTMRNRKAQGVSVDQRFGAEEQVWKMCIAAYRWYCTHQTAKPARDQAAEKIGLISDSPSGES